MRRVFVRFLEEIEDTKKTFCNQLTFSHPKADPVGVSMIWLLKTVHVLSQKLKTWQLDQVIL